MRALSLRQPFAWLTVYGAKNPENRTWKTEFRGWFLVHASAQWSSADEQLSLEMVRRAARPGLERDLVALLRNGPPVGGIVGAARLDSILEPQGPAEIPERWRLPGQYGYVLGVVCPVPFIPCKGLQRFWRVKPETQKELQLRIPSWLWLELQKND